MKIVTKKESMLDQHMFMTRPMTFEVIGDVGGWVGVTNKARDAHD